MTDVGIRNIGAAHAEHGRRRSPAWAAAAILGLAVGLATPASAGSVTFCNDSASEIRVAIGVKHALIGKMSWGWVHVAPNACKFAGGIGDGGGYLSFRVEQIVTRGDRATRHPVRLAGLKSTSTYCVLDSENFQIDGKLQRNCDGVSRSGDPNVFRDFHEINIDSSSVELRVR